MANILEKLELTAQSMYCKTVEELNPSELHLALGKGEKSLLLLCGVPDGQNDVQQPLLPRHS